MSGYYVGIETDFKTNKNGMLATAEDVGIFLRALNDGSVFELFHHLRVRTWRSGSRLSESCRIP